jgi:sugar phosphate isomerase/epimerase
MLIGLKLDIDYTQDAEYRQLYGRRDVLPFLRSHGVDVVEAPVGPETQPEVWREHVGRCVDAGLQVTLHPYSEGTIFNPAYFADSDDNPCRCLHGRLFGMAAEVTQRQQAPTVVNIHGAAGTRADRRDHLVERSIAFFTWACAWCRENAPQVNVTVELQIRPDPDEPKQRIGDRYDELLEITTQSDVPVCWDFGHGYWNNHNYDAPIHLPVSLLDRIGHVHCHDVHGNDHQALVYDVVPWRAFIQRLIGNGYNERIILEVPPSGFLPAGGLDALTTSLASLREWVGQCQVRV